MAENSEYPMAPEVSAEENAVVDGSKQRTKLAAHLGESMREARKRASMTQLDVAERIGLVTEVLGRMERGHMLPSVPTLRRLCLVLRLDANAILGLDAEKAPSWTEEAEPVVEESPEMRRMMRMLRRMSADQLAVVSSTATAVLRHTGQKPEGTE